MNIKQDGILKLPPSVAARDLSFVVRKSFDSLFGMYNSTGRMSYINCLIHINAPNLLRETDLEWLPLCFRWRVVNPNVSHCVLASIFEEVGLHAFIVGPDLLHLVVRVPGHRSFWCLRVHHM
jgi:hypothetical protein